MAPPTFVKRHHGLGRLAHWLNAVVLLGTIASGLQIYMVYRRFGMREERSPLNWSPPPDPRESPLQLDTVSCRDLPVVLERGKPVGRAPAEQDPGSLCTGLFEIGGLC